MISVDGLVATRSLGLEYLAGAHGGARVVSWAHVCDLPDPWRWCKPGDMVMTTCGGLPEQDADQAEWLQTLIDSGVSALVLAPRPGAPVALPRLISTADKAGFPVLSASFDLKFVTLARVVIESAVRAERERLAATKRMYDLYLTALGTRADLHDRLEMIGRALGWHLRLEFVDGNDPAGAKALDDSIERPHDSEDEPRLLAIQSRRPAHLRAIASGRGTHDHGLLQHLVGVVALELEQQALVRDSQRESGAVTLRALISGQ